jgi:hypothetical protein
MRVEHIAEQELCASVNDDRFDGAFLTDGCSETSNLQRPTSNVELRRMQPKQIDALPMNAFSPTL